MSDPTPKTRPWLDAPSELGPPLRSLLESAALDEPGSEAFEAVGARIAAATASAPMAGTGAATGGAGAPFAAGATLARIAVAVLTVAAGGGAYRALRSPAAPPRSASISAAQRASTTGAPSSPPQAAARVAPAVLAPSVAPAPSERVPVVARPGQRAARVVPAEAVAPVTGAPTVAVASAAPAEDEAAVLLAALSALRAGDLDETERRIAQHRRDYPQGDHREERDRCAIELLLRRGQRGEAERAAEGFRHAYPGSAQQRRIDRLLQIDGDASIGS